MRRCLQRVEVRLPLLVLLGLALILGAAKYQDGTLRVAYWSASRAVVLAAGNAAWQTKVVWWRVTGRQVVSWTVAGAGDASYNGAYTESGTDPNGNPYYFNGTRYLGERIDLPAWGLFPTDDSAAYWHTNADKYRGTSGTLSANPWGQGPGEGPLPAPVISARGIVTARTNSHDSTSR